MFYAAPYEGLSLAPCDSQHRWGTVIPSTDAGIPGDCETESGGLNPPSVREYSGAQGCQGGQIAAPTAFQRCIRVPPAQLGVSCSLPWNRTDGWTRRIAAQEDHRGGCGRILPGISPTGKCISEILSTQFLHPSICRRNKAWWN